jgi:hypothetical protein
MTDIAIQQTTVDGVTKYTMAFPLTDEEGNAILDRAGKPRFTNLIADSESELAIKAAQGHLEVSRALNRANQHIDTLKNKRPTPARVQPDLRPKPMTADEQLEVGLQMQDPRKAAAAIEKVIESRVAPVATAVENQGKNLDIEARRRIAGEFFSRHPEYNLSANGQMLGRWLQENGYDFTLDNIEIAFATLQDRLARIAPRNEPPVVAAPDNAAPGNETPNPGDPPTPPRRAPVSGISNSQATGAPVSRQHFPYTRDQLLTMAYKHDQKYLELIRNPATNAMVNAVLAGR